MQKSIKLSSSSKKSIVLSIKKNKLIRRMKILNIGNSLLISKIIKSDILDKSIKKINNNSIDYNNKPVLKKEYIDSYNHYIYILDNFIHYFYSNFNSNIDLEYEMLIGCLKENSDILLCKKYVFDNDNINFYREEYNKIIINCFYYNICTFSDDIDDYLKRLSINIKRIDINNSNDINKILKVLKDIYMYNSDKHVVLSLFNKVDNSTHKFYLDGFEFMLYSYFNKIKTNYKI